MNKKVFLMMAIMILSALVLGACTRSAVSSGTAAPKPTAEVPFPVSTKVTNFATQTAVAAAPKGATAPAATAQAQPTAAAPAVATATSQPGAPVVVPTATSAPQQPQQPQPTQKPQQPQSQPQEEPVSIPTLTRPSTYTLQRGEFPFCIARRFDVDAGTLLSINGLGTASRPGVGTVLRIPQSGNWNPANGSRALRGHPDTYVVQGSDSIYSIACLYGDVSPEGIMAANRLSNPGDIHSGMTLQIP
jgi:LysM repeat protein